MEIDAIRTTIFRQTLFAEFELQLHRFVEQGVPLTPILLKESYLKLNRTYYGPELILDGGVEAECFRIPHFYYDFYVYQYATGLSAAIALFEKAIHSTEAVENYLQFLRLGGSRYPLDLLQAAGVDLRKGAPIEAAMNRFSLLIEELRRILA
jgi:oligoendopeptidase F